MQTKLYYGIILEIYSIVHLRLFAQYLQFCQC